MRKKFFNMAVIMASLVVAMNFSSCNKDEEEDDDNTTVIDDNDNKGDDDNSKDLYYNFSDQKITVTAGNTYVYSTTKGLAPADGEFTVDSVATGYVKLTINNKTVELSDAGASYLSIAGGTMKQADAKENPSAVLFCLLSKSTDIAAGTQASNSDIAAGSTARYFFLKK